MDIGGGGTGEGVSAGGTGRRLSVGGIGKRATDTAGQSLYGRSLADEVWWVGNRVKYVYSSPVLRRELGV